MEPLFDFTFRVKKSPDKPEEVVEIYAPDIFTAMIMMAKTWPGVHVIEHLGIAPQKKGTA